MARSPASRKWQITINNPEEKGYTHDYIKQVLADFKSCVYWCICDEIGEEGTYHTHIFLACKNAVMFSTVKRNFNGGHFEMANGTSQQNRDYVTKSGKWEKDKKHETNLAETFEEWGECPIERQGARNDLEALYDMIKNGATNYEILEQDPRFMTQFERLDRIRQTIRENEYKSKFRELHTVYIYGKTGSGKTRSVMEKYGYEKVYRVTDYQHPFDGYKGQEIVVFEEYRSSFRIQDVLNYLDGYPLELPSRYNNKIACFTKVFILSNISLEDQYWEIQKTQPETYKAFLRRIHEVHIFNGGGDIQTYQNHNDGLKDYFNRLEEVIPEQQIF